MLLTSSVKLKPTRGEPKPLPVMVLLGLLEGHTQKLALLLVLFLALLEQWLVAFLVVWWVERLQQQLQTH